MTMINIINYINEILKSKSSPNTLISKIIHHIGLEVVYHDAVVTLSWSHIEEYINQHVVDLDSGYKQFFAHVGLFYSEASTFSELDKKDQDLAQLCFRHEKIAQSFVDFLRQILPIVPEEYPKKIGASVLLMQNQYYFFSLYGMQAKGRVPVETIGGHYYLKTLRADQYDYSHAFLLGIIPGENGRRLQNLRPSKRKQYVFTPDRRMVARLNKSPKLTGEQKKPFSQVQSCTLINNHCKTKAFGFNRGRDQKLYGLLTHEKDLIVNRLLPRDSGTVHRVFECEDPRVDHEMVSINGKFSYDISEFKSYESRINRLSLFNPSPNEVLARLRFDPHRSIISICSNTLEARLLAAKLGQELLQEFGQYTRRLGFRLNPKFKIPIIFYLPDEPILFKKTSSKNLCFYTSDMLKEDRAEASRIYNTPEEREKKFEKNDYEFLLGLKNITSEVFMEEVSPDLPLALHMLRQGYARILLRALGELKTEVFELLLQGSYIKYNDTVIAELIIVEAFDLAQMLLDRTLSKKEHLYFRGTLLKWYLVDNGNPRHIDFYGIGILNWIALWNSWTPVMLYIKEYPNTTKLILSDLLYKACDFSRYNEASRLLKMGASTWLSSTVLMPIKCAADKEDWAMVALIAQYPSDANDEAGYGYALLRALYKEQFALVKLLLQAGAKSLCWNWSFLENVSACTLYYGVFHGYSNLKELVDYEELGYSRGNKLSSRYRVYFHISCVLARDQAELMGDQEAVILLDDYIANQDSAELKEDPVHFITQRFFEALSMGNGKLAKYRLLKYAHAGQLLERDNTNIVDGLRIVLQYLGVISPPEKATSIKKIVIAHENSERCYQILCEILIELNQKDYIDALLSSRIPELGCEREKRQYDITVHKLVINALVKNLNQETELFIKEIIDKIDRDDLRAAWLKYYAAEVDAYLTKTYSVRGHYLLNCSLISSDQEKIINNLIEKKVSKRSYTIIPDLIRQMKLSEDVLRKILDSAITSREIGIVENIISTRVAVELKHIQSAAALGAVDILVVLLGAFREKHEFSIEYRNAFYNAWKLSSNSNELRCILYGMLAPHFIRHLVLIEVAVLIKSAITNANQGLDIDSKFVHLTTTLSDPNLHAYKAHTALSDVNIKLYNDVFVELNNYFSINCSLPSKDSVYRTFNRVFCFFSKMSGYDGGFFNRRLIVSFDRDTYCHLVKVNKVLSRKEPIVAEESDVKTVDYREAVFGVVF